MFTTPYVMRFILLLAIYFLLIAAKSAMPSFSPTLRRRSSSSTSIPSSITHQSKLPPPSPTPAPTPTRRTIHPLIILFLLYIFAFLTFSLSFLAQAQLTYLHWLRPPNILSPLQDLRPHYLASSARTIKAGTLQGWHLQPAGPPFSQTPAQFAAALSRPRQRVILFFHGNSGTRACPSKRVNLMRLFAAHFRAHVLTFDYSGFGDSPGQPSEQQLSADAEQMLAWVRNNIASDTDVVLYGQSLGSFVAVELAARVAGTGTLRAMVLDSAPASLLDAALTHPITWAFRIIPNMRAYLARIMHERMDSIGRIGLVDVPILLVHGAQDWMITVEQGERLYETAKAAGNKHVEFVKFEGCGHNSVTSSAQYLSVVNAFFDRVLSVPVERGY